MCGYLKSITNKKVYKQVYVETPTLELPPLKLSQISKKIRRRPSVASGRRSHKPGYVLPRSRGGTSKSRELESSWSEGISIASWKKPSKLSWDFHGFLCQFWNSTTMGSKNLWNRKHLGKKRSFPKKSNFWKSAISKTVPNIIYQHTIKILSTSWMRHLWHFNRIQSTALFYLHIRIRIVSSIAIIEFEAEIC